VAAKVIDGGRSPAYVADQLDLSLASVYETLAYYYDNAEEMRTLEQQNNAPFESVREQSVKLKEPVSLPTFCLMNTLAESSLESCNFNTVFTSQAVLPLCFHTSTSSLHFSLFVPTSSCAIDGFHRDG